MDFVRKVLAVVVVFMFLATTVNCRGGSGSEYPRETGTFVTDDIAVAQAKIPFTIIMPTYLPFDVGQSYLAIRGPQKGSVENGEQIEIEISYSALRNGDRVPVLIYERNFSSPIVGREESGLKRVSIRGIDVIQGDPISGFGLPNGVEFDWDKGGRSYTVILYSFTEEEGRKVVDSMISQD